MNTDVPKERPDDAERIERMTMQPVLRLQPLRDRLGAEAFLFFLQRVKKALADILEKREINGGLFTVRVDLDGTVRVMNSTRDGASASITETIIFDIRPDELRAIYDEAISIACDFPNRAAFVPESPPSISEKTLEGYIAMHRKDLENLLSSGMKPVRSLKSFGLARLPPIKMEALQALARKQLEREWKHSNEREMSEDRRFHARILQRENPRYDIARIIRQHLAEQREQDAFKTAHALVISERRLRAGETYRLRADGQDITIRGQIDENGEGSVCIDANDIDGKHTHRIALEKSNKLVSSTINDTIRLIFGKATTFPESVEGQWTETGLHVQTLKNPFFTSETWSSGALVDWAKTEEGE